MANVLDLIIRLSAEGTPDVRRGVDDVRGAITGLAKDFAALAGVTLTAGAAVDAWIKYDAAVRDSANLTGTAVGDMKALVLDSSVTMGRFAADVAAGFGVIGSKSPALLENAEALKAVSDASFILADAATATGDAMSDAEAASALGGMLNAYSVSVEDSIKQSERFANALAASAQVGSVSISRLNATVAGVGTSFAMAKVAPEELLAVAELLGEKSEKLQGSEAATALNSIIISLQNAGDKFKEYGISGVDAVLKTEGFSAAMKKLAPIMTNSSALVEIFGKDHANAVNILVGNTAAIDNYNKKITGTNTAYTQAQEGLKTFSKQIGITGDMLRNIAAFTIDEVIGPEITPTITALNDGLKEVFRSLMFLSETDLTPLLNVLGAGGLLWAGMAAAPAIVAGVTTAMTAYTAITSGAVNATVLLNQSLWGTTLAAQAATGWLGKLQIAGGFVFAAFAGWQIGSYLYKEFETARVGGVLLVSTLMKGWEAIRSTFDVMATAVAVGWSKLIAFMADKLSVWAEKAAGWLPESLPGAVEMSNSLMSLSQGLSVAAKSGKDWKTEMAGVEERHKTAKAEIAAFEDDALAAAVASRDNAKASQMVAQATDGVAAAAPKAAAALDKKREKLSETEKAAKQAAEAVRGMWEALEKETATLGLDDAAKKAYDMAEAMRKAGSDEATIRAKQAEYEAQLRLNDEFETAVKQQEDMVKAYDERQAKQAKSLKDLETEIGYLGMASDEERERAKFLADYDEKNRDAAAALYDQKKAVEEQNKAWEMVGGYVDKLFSGWDGSFKSLWKNFKSVALQAFMDITGGAGGLLKSIMSGAGLAGGGIMSLFSGGAAASTGGAKAGGLGGLSSLSGLMSGGGLGQSIMGLGSSMNSQLLFGLGSRIQDVGTGTLGLTGLGGGLLGGAIGGKTGGTLGGLASAGLALIPGVGPLMAGLGGGLLGGLVGGLFGGKKKTTGGGLMAEFSGLDLSGNQFSTWEKAGFLGKKKKGEDISALTADAQKQLQTVEDSLRATIKGFSDVLGKDLTQSLDGFKASFKGKAEDLGKWLEQTQADMLKQSIENMSISSAFDSTLKTMVGSSDGAAASIQSIITGLLSAKSSFEALKIDTDLLTPALIQASGGIEQLQGSLNFFYEQFYTDTERATAQLESANTQLAAGFAELGIAVPETRAEFRALVESLKANQTGADETLASLLKLANSADLVYDAAESAAPELEKAAEALEKIDTAANGLTAGQEAYMNQAGQLPQISEDAYNAMVYGLVPAIEQTSETATAAAEDMSTAFIKWRDAFGLLSPLQQAQEWVMGLGISAEQFAAQVRGVSFADFQGIAAGLGVSTDELMRAVDDTYGALQRAADGTDTLEASVTELADTATAAARSLADIDSELTGALQANMDNALGALRESVNAEKDARKAAYDQTTAAIDDTLAQELKSLESAHQWRMDSIEDERKAAEDNAQRLRGIADSLRGAIESAGIQSEATALDMRRAAQAQLRQWAAGGGLPQQAELDKALAAVSGDSQRFFGSFVDYARDAARTAGDMGTLAARAESQASVAEQTLASLDSMAQAETAQFEAGQAAAQARHDQALELATAQYEADIAGLEQQYTDAEMQLNRLLGIETATLTVADAVLGVQAALGLYSQAIASGLQVQQSEADSLQGQIDALIQERNDAQITQALSAWNSVAATQSTGPGIPAFADGGTHSGGLAIVGERGPELVNLPPARIQSNTASRLSFDELLAEIRALRQDMQAGNFALAKNTGKAANILQRWEGAGMPETRVSA